VNYRSFHGDPINRVDPSQATIEWRDQGKPESELVGIQYTCPGVRADLVVDDPSEWIWRGTGVTAGTRLHELVWGEADHLAASSPRPIDVLATSPVMCGRSPDTGNTTYYSAPSGAGVFASGTLAWICSLDLACLKRATFDDMRVVGVVRRATMNILQSFADGPAGLVHRSTGRAS
jgi:hypothetical protein